MKKQHSISLKAYRCPQTGRDIHYSFAHLRRGDQKIHPPSSSPPQNFSSSYDASNNNNDVTTIIGPSAACWIFFYPAGPNRRLLEAVISRYTSEFECNRDVYFICLNRPGKGGTSSSSSDTTANNVFSPEQEYIRTACNDVVTIIDYYQVPKVSLFYMCAGSTFAYSFAKLHPERTTGYILGLSSWILRHDGKRSIDNDDDDDDDGVDCTTPPNMNSRIHSWAMHGYFGPKSIISSLAGGLVGSAPGLLNSFPQQWVVNGFKKELSNGERFEFDEQYPEDGGVAFLEGMKWSYEDGDDGDGSVFVNIDANDVNDRRVPNKNDGNANDIAVCLSTQQDLGMEYKSSVPKQKRILLWHGENDRMVNVAGAEYLESMLSNATLSYVSEGTHQGTMFFFPRDLMLELNQISNLK